MTQLKEFILTNFKTLVLAMSFIVTMYIQHVNNTAHIEELQSKCTTLEAKIEDQYRRIDAIKLDKTVFEANMMQFASIQTDLREMRNDIKELLKNKR